MAPQSRYRKPGSPTEDRRTQRAYFRGEKALREIENNGNGIFILDQLIQAGREYLKVATTGEEFAWLAEQIPPESATFNQLIEKWDDCMIFCIRQMETIEEIVQAYHSSPRGGGAQDYALYRIVQITLEDSGDAHLRSACQLYLDGRFL